MLKTTTPRTLAGRLETAKLAPPAGEAAALERAPWRHLRDDPPEPLDEPASSARSAYLRTPAPIASPPGSTGGPGGGDLREVGRTIEARRRTKGPAEAPGAKPAERPDKRPRPGASGDDALAIVAPDVARMADKADVARLERMLADVLGRLDALEGRRPAGACRADGAKPTDAEARWAARWSRSAASGSARSSQLVATEESVPAAGLAPASTRPEGVPAPRTGTPRRLWS